MASELPKFQYNYFMVYAPDVPDTQRLKHLPEHMVQNAPLFKNGTISELCHSPHFQSNIA